MYLEKNFKMPEQFLNRVLGGEFVFHLIGNGCPNTIQFFGFMSDKSTSESEHLLLGRQCSNRQRSTDKLYYMWIRALGRSTEVLKTRFKASWMPSVALLFPHDAYSLLRWHTKNSNVKKFCIILLQTFGIHSPYWLKLIAKLQSGKNEMILACSMKWYIKNKYILVTLSDYGDSHRVRGQFKRDGTRVETRFRFSAKRTSPFKSAGASVESTTDSRGVHISGSNAGYTMFRGSVKGTGYPLHSPVSPSLPLPCITVFHHISNGVY